MSRRFLPGLAGLLAAAAATTAVAAPARPASPRLVVTIVVDQFAADLFNAYRTRFTGGLRTLADEGVVYANGYQSHAATETCPGHSTVLTGMRPGRTGIPSNSWLDRATGKTVYCMFSATNQIIGKSENGVVGSEALRVDTLGDWLKARTPGSKVYAVSGKDRGAINLAGHKAEGAFWYEDDIGFTTYLEPGQSAEAKLAPLAPLNAALKARLAKTPPKWTYRYPQCRALEADWTIGDKPFHAGLPPLKDEFDTSPALDEATLEAATALLDGQKLGRGADVDVLGVSLSATDRIGHRYGSQGPEMCEQMLRLDAALGAFLAKLKTVPGGAIVALTADHGGSDFPERMSARGYGQARRGDPETLPRVNLALRALYGFDFDPLKNGGGGLYVFGKDGKGMAEPQRSEIARAAVALLKLDPIVADAVTLEDALAAPPPPRGTDPTEYTLAQRQTLSAVAGRSADILFALQPGVTPGRGAPGGTLAGHGTPWDYDRKVPIIFWWPGSVRQERTLAIETADIAPTLAPVVGLPTPAGLDGRCLSLNIGGVC